MFGTRLLLVIAAGLSLCACGSSPTNRTEAISLPVAAVADELLSIGTRQEDSELKLPVDTAAMGADGAILWTITYAGAPVAQLKMSLTPDPDGSGTQVSATYAEAPLSARALKVPNLADRSFVRGKLFEALDWQLKGLNPALSPFQRFVNARAARQILADISFEELPDDA